MNKLTARAVAALKEPGRYGDGGGLMAFVGKDGSRRWVLRIQLKGKRRDIGLGSLADVSLAEARMLADDMRRAFREGRDPVAERKRIVERMPTFKRAAELVHAEHSGSWRNAKHAAQWISTLKSYAFKHFGDTPIDEIDAPMVRDALAEIWLIKPETARRVRQRIGTVLDFAHAKGWRPAEAPMRAISRGLPKQPRKERHFAAMPWREVPGFVAGMADILSAGEPVRLAIEFCILTAARSGEVRGVTWAEVDLEGKCWTVPDTRMKAGRAHRVPLSGRAVTILERMKELRRTDDNGAFVFEGLRSGKPLSDMSLTMPIRRAALGVTVHGFRSSFRDWCAEATETPREVAEAALAHVVQGVEGAYARTDHYNKRAALMERWTAFIIGETAKVVKLRQATVLDGGLLG